MITKINILRKMIGKKVFVITDFKKYEGYIGFVSDIKDKDNLIVKSNDLNRIENIFNIRSIPYEF